MKAGKILLNGLFTENPTFRLVLGMCPTLATTTSVDNGIGMGLATTAVLVGSNAVISAIRKLVPNEVRIPCFIVVIASLVTVTEMVMKAFVPALYESLGIFIPLIVVNCIILGRAEMFACKNTVGDSILDGIGMGIGYTLCLLLMATIREILGTGVWGAGLVGAEGAGIRLLPEGITMSIMTQPPAGFFWFGVLMAGCIWLERKLNAPIERKVGCQPLKDIQEAEEASEADKQKGEDA